MSVEEIPSALGFRELGATCLTLKGKNTKYICKPTVCKISCRVD
jgi:hypothetical protein